MEKRSKRPNKYGLHNMSNTRAYSAWKNLRARCKGYQKKCKADYVDRGITYCKEWDVFLNFYNDMGDPPEGMTLDRRDNDLGYSKENCRWATRSQQQLNQRPIVKHNKSGVKGVCFDNGKKKWLATYRGKFVGYADTIEACSILRKKAENENITGI